MTQPAKAPATQTLELPRAEWPACIRAWSKHPLRPEEGTGNLLWVWGAQHPLIATHQILRMYVVPGGSVEVFSLDANSEKRSEGLRHTIPWHMVLLTEEVMDAQTFVNEIAQAEAGDDGDDGGDEGEDEDVPDQPVLKPLPDAPALVPINGQGGNG